MDFEDDDDAQEEYIKHMNNVNRAEATTVMQRNIIDLSNYGSVPDDIGLYKMARERIAEIDSELAMYDRIQPTQISNENLLHISLLTQEKHGWVKFVANEKGTANYIQQ
jgi:hypothetical protein